MSLTATLFSLAVLPAPANAAVMLGTLPAQLVASVGAFRGTASVVVRDPATGFRYATGDDRVVVSASLYKLGVMVEAYRAATAGELSLDGTTVTITDQDTGPDGWYTDAGTTLSVRDGVERMITVSDNSSAQALLRLLDAHRVNATTTALGLVDTRINTALPPSEQAAPYNTTSARDMDRLFLGLLQGTVVGPTQSRAMLDTLARQQVNDRIPTGVPSTATIAHKTGNLEGVAHDAGVVYTPFGPRIVVVLTTDYASYDDVVQLAGTVGFDAYWYPTDRFSAAVTSAPGTAAQAHAGEKVTVTLQVTNTSTFVWDPSVRLGAHWRDQNGRYVRWDSARVALPVLPPGGSATVSATDVAPAGNGRFTLEWEIVDEGIAWSGDRASLTLSLTSTGAANLAPALDPAAEAAAAGARTAAKAAPARPSVPSAARATPPTGRRGAAAAGPVRPSPSVPPHR